MTYERASNMTTRPAPRRRLHKKPVHPRNRLDSDDEDNVASASSPSASISQTSPTTTKNTACNNSSKPRRRSRLKKRSLSKRRDAPKLTINATAAKSVENDEDLREEHWTDAALDELFESALSAGSSPEHNASDKEEQFFSACSASP
eukprot:TRINITY_DN18147_c0_g1_i1.p1 TRINITY_DN18147_c0_g1~~TRINITY_DN18147_c0_g1_i1.p1  ORF type:complete len:147 (+),score=31.61 TRINITY_DN18147_c0_g1_i1:224-664(+)